MCPWLLPLSDSSSAWNCELGSESTHRFRVTPLQCTVWVSQATQLPVRGVFPLHSLLPCTPSTPWAAASPLEVSPTRLFLNGQSTPPPIRDACLSLGLIGWQGLAWNGRGSLKQKMARGIQAPQEEQQEEGYRQHLLMRPILGFCKAQPRGALDAHNSPSRDISATWGDSPASAAIPLPAAQCLDKGTSHAFSRGVKGILAPLFCHLV